MLLRRRILTASLSVLALAACSTTSQYTSGQDYLSRYSSSPAYAAAGTGSGTGIDARIREIAAVEPSLEFPARIGLARIERGVLVSIPADEAADWAALKDKLGGGYGEFIPVSPLIVSMVNDPSDPKSPGALVNNIRAGSARQHLDHVLIYEVSKVSHNEGNALGLGNLTVLGLFVLPSRNVEVDTTATAMLIDVRNGYPYGTATAFSEKKGLSSALGASKQTRKVQAEARLAAVENLSGEVEVFMRELRKKSGSARLAALNPVP